MRILIKNGTLVNAEGAFAGELLIEGESIAAIARPGTALEADQVIDAKGCYVLPGVVDPHVHLTYGRNPEDYDTETAAAARGGVTTMLSYNWVQDDYADWFKANRAQGEKLAHIDFGFHFGLMNQGHIQGLDALHEKYGVSSYKFYMQYMNNPGRKKGMDLNYADMRDAFLQVAKDKDRLVCVHCEDPDLIERLSARVRGREEPAAWLESRPGFTESRGVQAALDFAAETGASCYLVHVSAQESLELIRRYNRDKLGPRVWVETCPHYLCLDYEDIKGTLGKVNPPLRTDQDNEALWQAVAEGLVDTIGSDHIARNLKDKEGGLWAAKSGFPGSYAILPIVFSQGHLQRGIPLNRVVELTSSNSARIFGLYPSKGSLQPGTDADLVVLDPELEKDFAAEDLGSGSGFSLYQGIKAKGWPSHVFIRGKAVIADGRFQGAPGHGKYLSR